MYVYAVLTQFLPYMMKNGKNIVKHAMRESRVFVPLEKIEPLKFSRCSKRSLFRCVSELANRVNVYVA